MTSVLCRRLLLTGALFVFVGGGAAAQSRKTPAPAAIVAEIYRRARRNRDSPGFTFPLDPRDRREAFSKAILDSWRAADARTQPGDEGPLGFDPVTNSQDSSSLGGFRVAASAVSGPRARVDVTMTTAAGVEPRAVRADTVVHYDFVLEDGRWRIDDISGTIDGAPWSLRKILAAS